MKIIIIEDEPLAAKRMAELIGRYDSSIEILAKISLVKKAVAWFDKNPMPDLAFMDIQLADGLSFEIFEKTKVDCPVIFTTAFDEYAVKAFKVNSVDYLLKPIDFDELSAAFEKYKNNFIKTVQQNNLQPQAYESILQMLTSQYKNRFVVKVGGRIKPIEIDDVSFFYSMDKATYIQVQNGRAYNIDFSLEQIEELVDPKSFFKINRKYIVNFKSITDISSFKNSRLKIKLANCKDDDIFVSRDKVASFKSWLDT